MRKKILCFILALAFIFPSALALVACGGDSVNADEKYAVMAEQIDTNKNNFTATTNKYYEAWQKVYVDGKEYASPANSDRSEGDFVIKVDGNNIYVALDNEEDLYFVDGVLYTKTAEGYAYTNAIGTILATIGYDIDLGVISDTLKTFTTQALKLDSKAITATQANGVTTVSVSLNLKATITKLIKTVIANQDKKIGELIDAIVLAVSGKQINIVETINTELDKIDENTTVGDILDQVGELVNYDVKGTLNILFEIAKKAMELTANQNDLDNDVDVYNDPIDIDNDDVDPVDDEPIIVDSDDEEDQNPMEMIMQQIMGQTFAELMNTKVLETISTITGETITTQNLKDAVNGYLDNEDYTIGNLIANSSMPITLDTDTILQTLNLVSFDKVKLSIEGDLNSNDELTAIRFVADGQISMLDSRGKNGMKMGGKAIFELAFSDFGTTVVEAPETITKSEVHVVLDITEEKDEYVIDLKDYPILANTNITWFEGDEQETFNLEEGTLTLPKAYIEAQLENNNIVVKFEYNKGSIVVWLVMQAQEEQEL